MVLIDSSKCENKNEKEKEKNHLLLTLPLLQHHAWTNDTTEPPP